MVYSQEQIKIFDKNTKTEVNFKNVAKWQDGSPMNDSRVDGVIYVKNNGKYYQRDIEESINVKWFGAVGDGIIDDTKAFQNLFHYLGNAKFNYKVFIPEGEYIIKKKLLITGFNNLPTIKGAGMRNTILNFSQNTDDYCLQIGDANKNSIGGGVSDLQIKANSNVNGLYITARAPYSVTENNFQNLYFCNLKNGIVEDDKGIFYNAHFSNIKVEKYYGVALTVRASYNNYYGIFVVQASGTNETHKNMNFGKLNLALDAGGAHNIYNSFQSEDQILITSSFNTFNAITVEVISKPQFNPNVGETVISVQGSNNIFNRLTLIGIPAKQYKYLTIFAGQNNTLLDGTYTHWNKPEYKVTYPFYPSPESSGIMMNCVPNTTVGLENTIFNNSTKNWSFINVMGSDNKNFSKLNNIVNNVSTEEREKLRPEEGTEIYNTTTHSKEYWNGSQWKIIKTN